MSDNPVRTRASRRSKRSTARWRSKPKRDGEAFAATTEHLCRMRDLLIAHCRAGADDHARLGQLNAIISSALAGHFPLGNTPWPEVEKARDALRNLVTELPS